MPRDAFHLCLSIISQALKCLENIFHFPLCLCLLPGQRQGFWEGSAFPIKQRMNGLELFFPPASISCPTTASVSVFPYSSLSTMLIFPTFSPSSTSNLQSVCRPPRASNSHETFFLCFCFHCREKRVSEEMYVV